jgi:cysteinyl-tRNA synthetase
VLERVLRTFLELGSVLNVFWEMREGSGAAGGGELADGLVRLLIEMRREARAAKEWRRADEIRDRLAGLGVVLEDGQKGTVWKRVAPQAKTLAEAAPEAAAAAGSGAQAPAEGAQGPRVGSAARAEVRPPASTGLGKAAKKGAGKTKK